MAKRPTRSKKPELTSSTGGVVVGWTHHDLGTSIDLRIQSVQSKQALDSNDIDSRHFLVMIWATSDFYSFLGPLVCDALETRTLRPADFQKGADSLLAILNRSLRRDGPDQGH